MVCSKFCLIEPVGAAVSSPATSQAEQSLPTDLAFYPPQVVFISTDDWDGDYPRDFIAVSPFHQIADFRIIKKHRGLSRHGILHGIQTKYNTYTNSLRVFLGLDILLYISDGFKIGEKPRSKAAR